MGRRTPINDAHLEVMLNALRMDQFGTVEQWLTARYNVMVMPLNGDALRQLLSSTITFL